MKQIIKKNLEGESPTLSGENTQSQNMCDVVFEKTKVHGGTVKRTSVYAEAAVRRVLLKSEGFCRIHKKTSVRESIFDKVKLCRSATSLKTSLQRRCFLMNFPKFVRTPF